ncbi:hypothetical protein [Agromyces sp. CF514]|uniref:hypothetical protein n=1 Tax=Agromyces sp. CF514 TaxID=1881031 RepID=UPI00116067C6|nr:hypothetical protein [Agromyces sp. CF514]
MLSISVVEQARAEDDLAGTPLSVTILDEDAPTTTPPTTGPTGATGSPGAVGALGGMGGSQPTAPAASDTAVPAAPASDELSMGGVLYIGGLESTFTPSTDPLAGDVDLSFTVRNASKKAFDSRATFWIETPFGARLDSARADMEALAAGESRRVQVRLTGVGQWPIVNASVTLTPPTQVEGTELTPITRETTVLAFPWALALFAVLVGSAVAVFRLLRSKRLVTVSPRPQGAAA